MDFQRYATSFFGFGRWDAPVWFVGTEEAGNPTPTTFAKRLAAWQQRGQVEIEDAPSFYPAVDQSNWHGEGAVLEPTFRQLIRIYLGARGLPADDDSILDYQQSTWGSHNGHVLLTELSPMPAPGYRAAWPYATWPDAPNWLQSRESFMSHTRLRRVAALREKIAIHRPRAVIFYFWKPRDCVEAIAGGEFTSLIPEQLLGFQRAGTHYFITGHPAGRYGDSYFQRLGQYLHVNHRSLFAAHTPSLLEKSFRIAADAHRWATRKNGSPYILHPLRVMNRLKGEDGKIVAILHDVVEDTHWTLDDLKREGFPDDILAALDCVTKRAGEPYETFIDRAASNPLARRVKIADLEDNMNLAELPEVTPRDQASVAKYVRAWQRLTSPNQAQPSTGLPSVLLGNRLEAASAIGLFLINFAFLDYLLFCFLESKVSPEELATLKRRHFKDRLQCVSELVEAGNYTSKEKHEFQNFLQRLEPVRHIRNHIAHGHFLLRQVEESETVTFGVALPKDHDAGSSPETRLVSLKELQTYASELVALIEFFTPYADLQ